MYPIRLAAALMFSSLIAACLGGERDYPLRALDPATLADATFVYHDHRAPERTFVVRDAGALAAARDGFWTRPNRLNFAGPSGARLHFHVVGEDAAAYFGYATGPKYAGLAGLDGAAEPAEHHLELLGRDAALAKSRDLRADPDVVVIPRSHEGMIYPPHLTPEAPTHRVGLQLPPIIRAGEASTEAEVAELRAVIEGRFRENFTAPASSYDLRFDPGADPVSHIELEREGAQGWERLRDGEGAPVTLRGHHRVSRAIELLIDADTFAAHAGSIDAAALVVGLSEDGGLGAEVAERAGGLLTAEGQAAAVARVRAGAFVGWSEPLPIEWAVEWFEVR